MSQLCAIPAADSSGKIASTTKLIGLDEINLMGDTQNRVALDDDLIRDYSEQMASGVKFPPLLVVFDGATFWLVDGFHRRWAAVKAKFTSIECEVVNGTREDARWLSYGVNQVHGLRRSNDDKQKAVLAALKHPQGIGLSDGAIAKHIGVSDRMVAKYRASLTPKDSESVVRTGLDGRSIKTGNIGRLDRSAAEPTTEADDDDDLSWRNDHVEGFVETPAPAPRQVSKKAANKIAKVFKDGMVADAAEKIDAIVEADKKPRTKASVVKLTDKELQVAVSEPPKVFTELQKLQNRINRLRSAIGYGDETLAELDRLVEAAFKVVLDNQVGWSKVRNKREVAQ